MEGIVLWGSNNIFHVEPGNLREEPKFLDGLPQGVECRLKGKQLSGTARGYNPLAPGDRVSMSEPDLRGQGAQALIEERLPRRNEFVRWNRKRNAVQTIAANLDLLIGISSPSEPPFRPRFIDRLSVVAELSEIPFGVVLNKEDQGISEKVHRRLDVYRELGFTVVTSSARDGSGVEELRGVIDSKEVAFLGQSGVGKSSILNALEPAIGARIGEVSRKYNRGRHTTTVAVRIPRPGEHGAIIDTPGIREIDLYAFPRDLIAWGFPEMKPRIPDCRIPGCSHLHEPGCAVRDALERAEIDPDRYESYRRIMEDHEISAKLSGEHRYGLGR